MQEKVYVVTKNGLKNDVEIGEFIYLLGVFTDEDTAKKVAEEHNAKITEIELNKVFPLKKQSALIRGHYEEYDDEENDYYLGGYAEDCY